MTQPIAWLDGPLWPYLALLLFAGLPTEIWRWLAVAFARKIPADSAVLEWVRAVATALLAAVVAKLVVAPPGALAQVPLIVPVSGLTAGLAVVLYNRRWVFPAVLVGEAVLIGGGFVFA